MSEKKLRETENGDKKFISKKRRVRPRTKAIRKALKDELESAILSGNYGLQQLLLKQEDGLLKASLFDVFVHLNLMAEPRFQSLTKAAIKSLSNVSRSFKIVDSIDETGMGKTNSAAEEPFKHLKELVISVDPRVYNDYDDKTVYVDNLPAQCSETMLWRRAAMFGTVSSVHLPKITRILHLTKSTLNSGFGFVRFASKTAARRFAKRYAVNSRLKRSKHGHHHKKKHQNVKKSAGNIVPPITHGEAMPIDPLGLCCSVHQKFIEDGTCELCLNTQGNNCDGCLIGTSGSSVEGTTSAYVKRKRPRIVYEPAENVESAVAEEPEAKRRFEAATLPIAIAERVKSNHICDSGNETENESVLLQQSTDKSVAKSGKKKRRRRRNIPRNRGVSITTLLKRIQVFPLKQYRELRSEYLKLKKEKMVSLKREILEKSDKPRAQAAGNNAKADTKSNGSKVEKKQNKMKRKEAKLTAAGSKKVKRHRSKRGRKRIFSAIDKVKLSEFF